MATLHLTYDGLSTDYPLDREYDWSDADVRKLAVGVVRAGALAGIPQDDLWDGAFDLYTVERRVHASGEIRIRLRPPAPQAPWPAKLPFGVL